MRVLTVRQPWAWAIIHGGKDVENRVRNIAGSYRGPVAIHAGLTIDKITHEHHRAFRAVDDRYTDALTTGAIVGVVDLVGVHEGLAPTGDRFTTVDSCFQPRHSFGPCSPWAEAHHWHLTLTNPRALTEPIPYKGALGLRTVDDETTERILEGIA